MHVSQGLQYTYLAVDRHPAYDIMVMQDNINTLFTLDIQLSRPWVILAYHIQVWFKIAVNQLAALSGHGGPEDGQRDLAWLPVQDLRLGPGEVCCSLPRQAGGAIQSQAAGNPRTRTR